MAGITPRPIYRNSSFAPTRGQNDPRGYIMRELAKRLGQGGQAQQPGLGQRFNAGQRPMLPQLGKTGPFGGVSRFGSTGRSETRSGLAKQAMAKNQGPQAPGQPRQVGASGHTDDVGGLAQSHLMRLLGIKGRGR